MEFTGYFLKIMVPSHRADRTGSYRQPGVTLQLQISATQFHAGFFQITLGGNHMVFPVH